MAGGEWPLRDGDGVGTRFGRRTLRARTATPPEHQQHVRRSGRPPRQSSLSSQRASCSGTDVREIRNSQRCPTQSVREWPALATAGSGRFSDDFHRHPLCGQWPGRSVVRSPRSLGVCSTPLVGFAYSPCAEVRQKTRLDVSIRESTQVVGLVAQNILYAGVTSPSDCWSGQPRAAGGALWH